MILWIPILSLIFRQSYNSFYRQVLSKFSPAAPLHLLFEPPQQGQISQLYYVVSYPAFLETPKTKRTIFQISQATRLSWKIVSLQPCFVKFGCGTNNIFFLQKCKISNKYFLQPHFTCNPYHGTISFYTHGQASSPYFYRTRVRSLACH